MSQNIGVWFMNSELESSEGFAHSMLVIYPRVAHLSWLLIILLPGLVGQRVFLLVVGLAEVKLETLSEYITFNSGRPKCKQNGFISCLQQVWLEK